MLPVEIIKNEIYIANEKVTKIFKDEINDVLIDLKNKTGLNIKGINIEIDILSNCINIDGFEVKHIKFDTNM